MNMKNELVQGYLDRLQKRIRSLATSTVVMPQEPRVSAREKTLVIPSNVWNSDNDQYGHIDELIEYLRQANRIPDVANLEMEMDDDFQTLRLHFQWWEVIIRHDPSWTVRR